MRIPKWSKRTVIVASVVVLAAGGGGVAYGTGLFGKNKPLADKTVGQQADGSYLMQTNQFVSPVGEVINERGRPFGLALSPDGKTAASLNGGGATTGMVTVFDVVNHLVVQQVGTGSKSIGGILYSADGKQLWATQPGGVTRFDVAVDGKLANQVTVKLPGVDGRQPVPAGLAWAPDGKLLVTLSANNTLGVIDPSTNTLLQQIKVGNVPNSIVLIAGKAFVSNQGGRPATAGDRTDVSYGTEIVTNNRDAVPSTGSVSEVDLAAGKEIKTFKVGIGPSAMLAVGSTLLVANTDDDTVSTIDTVRGENTRTFETNPAPGSPYGAQPNGLAMIDQTHLAVSLGRFNTVAVYQFTSGRGVPSFEGLIPTGSFPSGIAHDQQLGKLVIASEQGIGSVGPDGTINEGVGTNPATSKLGYNFIGTVQTVSVPSAEQMQEWTKKVFANNQWNGLMQRNASAADTTCAPKDKEKDKDKKGKCPPRKPVPVPVLTGDPSTIQHVFMIVKENRTYDQVLGDEPRGNGDPSLAQFGGKVTPNLHQLVKQFPLVDNLYSDGTNSAEGHHWLNQAFVNNYMQQMYGSYTRSYQTGDPMSNMQSGWIWGNAQRSGKSVVNWGEQIDRYVDAAGNRTPAGSWPQWYQDSKILEHKATGELHVPIGTYKAKTDIPSLQAVTKPNYPNFDLNIPDQYRVDLFQRDFAKYVRNNDLPNLNMMWLSSDHTNGTSPGRITPSAYVADSDLAVGRIVDTISHSKYWKNTAIFVIEDDSQNGVDHVDGHRNPTLVISPYAKRGAVVHSYYSQLNMIRTIEQILGMPPMNSQDLVATPMFDAFTNQPNFSPYSAVANQIPLDSTNPTVAQISNPAQKAWAQWSSKQDYQSEDMLNMPQANRDIWYSSSNFTRPYPGDATVLLPDQVLGAGTPKAKADGDGH